jgi:hypothetical protein
LTDEQLAKIEARHLKRKEFYERIPSGPYYYDSVGFIHNELAAIPSDQPASKQRKAGILVRNSDWFRPVDMDAHLAKTDLEVGSDLGNYVQQVLDHDVEMDVAALLAEVRRLRGPRPVPR